MWSAFTANEYSRFEHHYSVRYYGNIVAFPGTQEDFQKDKRAVFLKDGLAKYNVSAR